MIVNIDIQAAIAQRAGVGRYTKSLVENLGALAGDDELRLFFFDFQRKGTPFEVSRAQQKAIHWCPGRVAQGLWKKLGFPPYDWFAGAADVYHFPNFIRPPLTRGKSVVTIHDVSFLRMPETTESGNLAYLTAHIKNTVARSDAIIADSHFTSQEIQELLNVPAEKIFPVHLGLSEHVKKPGPAAIDATLKRLGISKPYLLHVGTLEPRKNIPFLIEVFEKLESFDGTLVIAGMKGWKYEPIMERMKNSIAADRICYIDYVAEEDLCPLYAGAELFVFPSLYEGFGFPPLEAMACGTAVVSSPSASLAEVLGEDALVVNGYDSDIWVSKIAALLGDTSHLSALKTAGEKRAQTFTWAKTAAETWGVYRRV